MKWVKELLIPENEAIEKRLLAILEFIFQHDVPATCYMSGLEATGRLGSAWTLKLNDNTAHEIMLNELIDIVKEEGQIFDIELNLKATHHYLIIIQDGSSLDVLGTGDELPASVMGDCKNGDLSAFGYPPAT